jgi:hypothetical protein
MSIVLLDVSGTVLDEIEALAVTTIMQRLEVKRMLEHMVLIFSPPEEMVVEGVSYLVSMLLGCDLLEMLPCA